MIDLMSIGIGIFVGGCIGFLIAAVRWALKLEALQSEYDLLYRDYCRVTDRDSRGRFVGGKGRG